MEINKLLQTSLCKTWTNFVLVCFQSQKDNDFTIKIVITLNNVCIFKIMLLIRKSRSYFGGFINSMVSGKETSILCCQYSNYFPNTIVLLPRLIIFFNYFSEVKLNFNYLDLWRYFFLFPKNSKNSVFLREKWSSGTVSVSYPVFSFLSFHLRHHWVNQFPGIFAR